MSRPATARISCLIKLIEMDAIMLGTGDLTEVALGWSTFSGDQISHYHINVSVPKTLVRYLVRWVADEEMADSPAQKVLHDILRTPISPELLPPVNGEIAQKSEDIIGPVELADFFLYPFIRFGMRPGKILFLANEVKKQGLFDSQYSLDDLYKWLKSFINRFFANQFKRTCMPEGPKSRLGQPIAAGGLENAVRCGSQNSGWKTWMRCIKSWHKFSFDLINRRNI